MGNYRQIIDKKLGLPTSRVRFYESVIYLYVQERSFSKGPRYICSYLRFNSDDQLVDYSRVGPYSYPITWSTRKWCQHPFRSEGYVYDPWVSTRYKPYDPKNNPIANKYFECDHEEYKTKGIENVYWQPVNTWTQYEDELVVAAESGNPLARLQLYWNNADDGLYWLCLAANQGHPNAQYRIAQLYEFGDDGIEKNFKRSYAWYVLAARSCHPYARKDAIRVSNYFISQNERVTVENKLENWSIIDCMKLR